MVNRPVGLLTAGLVLLFTAQACELNPTAVQDRGFEIVFQPLLTTAPTATSVQFVDNVHVLLVSGEETVTDTVIDWPLDQDTLVIAIRVDVKSTETRPFSYTFQGRAGETVLFEMTGTVEVAGSTTGTGRRVVSDSLIYVGPGADAASIEILDAPASLLAGESVQLAVRVLDEDGEELDAPVVWRTSDEALASVTADGLVQARHRVNRSPSIIAQVAYRTIADSARIDLLSAGVRFVTAADTLVALDDTVSLHATALAVDGEPAAGGRFEFTTLDSARVGLSAATDTTIRITARDNGAARVLASAGGLADTATVHIRQRLVAFDVAPDTLRLRSIGATETLEASGADRNGFPVREFAVAWESSNTGVASVDAEGVVTAIANGEAVVRGLSGALRDSVLVIVAQAVATLAISPDSTTLKVGDTTALTAVLRDAEGARVAGATFTWSATHPAIAAIASSADSTAMVTGVAAGTGRIVVSADGLADTATVVVVPATVTDSIQVSPRYRALDVGDTVHLSATAFRSDGTTATDPGVTWGSDNTDAASVSDVGVVTGAAEGLARITASLDAHESRATIPVLASNSLLATAFFGGEFIASAAPGARVAIPVRLDMSRVSPDGDLGSVQFELDFDPGQLAYDSASVLSGALTNVPAPGKIAYAYASVTPRGTSQVLLGTFHFTVSLDLPAGTTVPVQLVFTARPTDTSVNDYRMPVTATGTLRVTP